MNRQKWENSTKRPTPSRVSADLRIIDVGAAADGGLNLKSLPTLLSLFPWSSSDKVLGFDWVIHSAGNWDAILEGAERNLRADGMKRRWEEEPESFAEMFHQTVNTNVPVHRNWTLMTVMSCSDILLLFHLYWELTQPADVMRIWAAANLTITDKE